MKPCIISNETLSHGYPRRNINGKFIYLNRHILEQKLGRPVKEGYEACHSCNNTKCIEPEHIYEGTHQDNMWDLIKAGNTDFFGGYEKVRTHCPKGHEYTLENTRINRQGCRSCIICNREHATESNKRKLNFQKKYWAERNKAVAI
jgi:hypothetical protein